MINASQKEFKGIETAEEMQSFLKEKGKNHNYYYHYTAAGSLIEIIQSGYFFLTKGNYIKMNDQQECMAKGSLDVWDRTYIGCFSYGESENMAMWGLYSIPWEDAVRISIPQKEMREWICNRRTCVYAVTDDGAIVDSNIGNKHPKIELTDIVYIGRTESGNSLKLNWKDSTLFIEKTPSLQGIDTRPEMTGYIKNAAWRYENEVRIHAQFSEPIGYNKIAIKLPDEVINSMAIMTGPYFSGNIRQLLETQNKINNRVQESGFKDLVKYRTLCSMCAHKKFESE